MGRYVVFQLNVTKGISFLDRLFGRQLREWKEVPGTDGREASRNYIALGAASVVTVSP